MTPGERFHFEHAVDIDGETHFHGIGIFIGQGLHANDGRALVLHLDAPVDPFFAAGRDHHDLRQLVEGNQGAAVQFEGDVHLLGLLEVVVDVGRQDDLVFLREEARGLQTDDQVLLGRDRRPRPGRPWCRGPCPRRGCFQAVRFSGMPTENSAMPFLSVVSAGRPERGVGEVLRHGGRRWTSGPSSPGTGVALAFIPFRRSGSSFAGELLFRRAWRRHPGIDSGDRRADRQRSWLWPSNIPPRPPLRPKPPAIAAPPTAGQFEHELSPKRPTLCMPFLVAADQVAEPVVEARFGAADNGCGAISRRTP